MLNESNNSILEMSISHKYKYFSSSEAENCVVFKKKIKVQVYSVISNISSDFYIFTPCSLDLFSRVPSQLHREHTVLQPFRCIELIIHTASSVLPGTHFHLSQVKHLRVKCLAKGHKGNNVPILRGEKHDISLKILPQAGFETAWEAVTSAKLRALTIVLCPSLQNDLQM